MKNRRLNKKIESLVKEIEDIKNQMEISELRNIITEIKSSVNGHNSIKEKKRGKNQWNGRQNNRNRSNFSNKRKIKEEIAKTSQIWQETLNLQIKKSEKTG